MPRKSQVSQDYVDCVYLIYIIWQCEAFDESRKRLVKLLDKIKKQKRRIHPVTQRKIFAELQSENVHAHRV